MDVKGSLSCVYADCKSKFSSEKSKRRHLKSCKFNPDAKEEEHICSKCGKKLSRKDVYQRHISQFCSKDNESTKRKSDNDDKQSGKRQKLDDENKENETQNNISLVNFQASTSKDATVNNQPSNDVAVNNQPSNDAAVNNQPSSDPQNNLCACESGDKVPENHYKTREHYEKYAAKFGNLTLEKNTKWMKGLPFFFDLSKLDNLDIKLALSNLQNDIIRLCEHVVSNLGPHDLKMVLVCTMGLDDGEQLSAFFHSGNIKLYEESNYEEATTEKIDEIMEDFEYKDFKRSGWALEKIDGIFIYLSAYMPLKFGCGHLAELPEFIKNKKACVNMSNTNQKCFLYCILIHKYSPNGEHTYRPKKYAKHLDEFNLDGLEFPITLNQIVQFAENNSKYCFNIFSYDEKKEKIRLEHQTKKHKTRINLLILVAPNGTFHFALIRSLSRLLSSQISSHEHKIHVCDECINYFTSEAAYESHKRFCDKTDVDFPKGGRIEFKEFTRTLPVSGVFYFDFESLLKPREDPSDNGNIKIRQEHIPYGYGYMCKTRGIAESDEYFKQIKCYFKEENGLDAPLHFLQNLRKDAVRFYETYLHPSKALPIIMNDYELDRYLSQKTCEFCDIPFTKGAEEGMGLNEDFHIIKNRHHWHTGYTSADKSTNYLAALCSKCNLSARQPSFLVACAHNISYDAVLLFRYFADIQKEFKNDNIEVMLKTSNNFITFTWYIQTEAGDTFHIKFLDSYKFNPGSLASISSIIDVEDMEDLKRIFPDDYKLLARKQILPYSYFSSPERFKCETFPGIEYFSDILRGRETCSQEDYTHAVRVFNIFKEKHVGSPFTMQHYYEMYLKVDILLLCAVMERQRKLMAKSCLESLHFVTLPSLAFNLMLKETKVKLDYLKTREEYDFFKNSLRGGICVASVREAVANTPDMPTFDDKKPVKGIYYVDINSSYPAALSEYLPESDFKITEFADDDVEGQQKMFDKVMKLTPTSLVGCFLNINCYFPESTHEYLEDFPPLFSHTIPPGGKHKKLLADLFPKYFYHIHYENFQRIMKYGAVITKIHSVMEFNQSPYMRKFINGYMKKRAEAKSPIDNSMYKWIMNSIYGKTLSKNDYRDFHFVSQFAFSGSDYDFNGEPLDNPTLDAKNAGLKTFRDTKFKNCAQFYYSHPNFIESTVISDQCELIELKRVTKMANSPIQIGACILEKSKGRMLDFIYEFVKPQLKKFNDELKRKNPKIEETDLARVITCYCDTDSYILYTENCELYQLQQGVEEKFFDLSNIPDEILQRQKLKKCNPSKLGMYKNETKGYPIERCICFNSKCYFIKKLMPEGVKLTVTNAGVSAYNRNNYKEETYEEMLRRVRENDPEPHKVVEGRIRLQNFQAQTIEMTKTGLITHNDKRWRIPGNEDFSYPYGHFKILKDHNVEFHYDPVKSSIHLVDEEFLDKELYEFLVQNFPDKDEIAKPIDEEKSADITEENSSNDEGFIENIDMSEGIADTEDNSNLSFNLSENIADECEDIDFDSIDLSELEDFVMNMSDYE